MNKITGTLLEAVFRSPSLVDRNYDDRQRRSVSLVMPSSADRLSVLEKRVSGEIRSSWMATCFQRNNPIGLSIDDQNRSNIRRR